MADVGCLMRQPPLLSCVRLNHGTEPDQAIQRLRAVLDQTHHEIRYA